MIRVTNNSQVDKDDAPQQAPGFHVEWHLRRQRGRSALKQLAQHNTLSHLQVMTGTLLLVAGVVASIAAPLVIRIIIDGYKNGVDGALVGWAIGLMVASAGLTAMGNYFFSLAGLTLTRLMQNKTYATLLEKPVSFFDSHPSGQLAGRLVNNLSLIKEYFSGGYPNLVNGSVMVVGTAIVLFYLNWLLTLMVLITLPIFGIALAMIGPRVVHPVEQYQNELSDYSAMATESFANIRMVKANGAESTFTKNAEEETKSLNRIGRRMAKVLAFVQPIMSTLLLGIIALIFAVGGYMIAHGQMTNGTLVSFILFAFQIAGPVSNFSSYIQTRKAAEGAAASLQDQLNSVVTENNEGKSLDGKEISRQPLQLSDVTLQYAGNRGITKVSLVLQPQHLYALVGPSGAGKSTLMGMIERFYEPDTGKICLGDQPIARYAIKQWRAQIAYVPQVSEITSGTFKNYLKMGNPTATDEQLNAVLRRVDLGEWVNGLPQGLDSPLHEYGNNMSGGQRQRLTIAQALLRDANIYLFDEVTANLDADSENIIRGIMHSLAQDHMVVSAAHRLSSIRDADEVIVLEDGRVTGVGTPQSLSNTNDTYARYLKEQTL
ncbi:ABC transporter ATP-binding protein [Schleiferilactobacillus shenzhenensis]|nr:ABC transporter ATP-binding protein [Schleiferilactobacillus shenzhenensis]